MFKKIKNYFIENIDGIAASLAAANGEFYFPENR